MNEDERARLIRRLGLDREALERTAHRTHQWGEAILGLLDGGEQTEERANKSPPSTAALRGEAASLFTIAGCYRMLLDPALAHQSLLAAALLLARGGDTFSYPLAICAGEPEFAFDSALDLPPALDAQSRAHALLALSWMDVTEETREGRAQAPAQRLLHRHLDEARERSEAAVGRLGVPLRAVAEVTAAADRTVHGEAGPSELSRTLHDALLRMHDVTAAAMGDRYHWQRLMSAILPVEPEAVVLAGVAMAAALRAGVAEEMFERVNLPPVALVPLELGRDIAEQAL